MDHLLTGLRAAAEPTRLRLLALCARAELTVSDLTQILGQSQPRVSRHLKQLCDAGLLDRSRDGAWVHHRLARGGRDLARRLVDLIPADDPALALDLERLAAIQRARADRAAEYFRRNAANWDAIRSLHVDEGEVERALLGLIERDGTADMLDIGTGTGRMLVLLGPHIGQGLGVDASRAMLDVARAKLDEAGLRNCVVRHGDMYQLALPGAAFDLVTIHQVLHFAEHPVAAIAEAARVLRPGGQLVVVDFAPHGLETLRLEHQHLRLGISDADMAEWCRAAGLVARPALRLPGDPLTVMLWAARRPARRASDRASGRDSLVEVPA
jgi:ArsR family transcriptional regulator